MKCHGFYSFLPACLISLSLLLIDVHPATSKITRPCNFLLANSTPTNFLLNLHLALMDSLPHSHLRKEYIAWSTMQLQVANEACTLKFASNSSTSRMPMIYVGNSKRSSPASESLHLFAFNFACRNCEAIIYYAGMIKLLFLWFFVSISTAWGSNVPSWNWNCEQWWAHMACLVQQ